jgi:hypothetical protein
LNYTLVFFIIFLFCGLVVDVGNAEWQSRNAQVAADAAAKGANLEMQRGASDWVAAGRADAAANGYTNGVNGVTVTILNPPTSGAYSGESGAVQALVTKSTSSIFMRIFNYPGATVAATAVAGAASATSCFYALDSSMSRAVQIGGGGTVTLGCGAYVDSSSSSAMNLDGGGDMTASSVSVVGNYTNSGTLSPTPQTGAKSLPDPLASVASPTFSACTHTNWQMNSSTGSLTLSPGTYCGGLTISGGSGLTATFNPGLYIVTGGINWNAQVNVVGSGVTFYFTEGGGSSYGQVTISGQVTVNLSAPTSTSAGGITGILFFGDRAWDSTSQNVNINGGSSTKLEGILYFPTTGVIVTGGTTCNGNYLGLVADNITVNGGASWTAPSPNYSALTGGNPFKGTGGGLVQ